MKVTVNRSPGRLALSDVPPEIERELTNATLGGKDEAGGLKLALELRNSLAMSSGVYVDEGAGTATIVLDWAQMERMPLVWRAIDWDEEIQGQYGSFLKAAARELRLYWKRKLVSSRPAEISDEERWYDGRQEGDLEPIPPFTAHEFGIAARYGMFLFSHETSHLLAREYPEAVDAHFARFEEYHPRLINPSPSLAEELFCDFNALTTLADMPIYPSVIDLNNEFALAMAFEQLQNEVRAAAPRIRASSAKLFGDEARPHSDQRELRMIAEWRYRMFQIDLTLDELLKEAGCDEESRAAAKETREALSRWPRKVLEEDYMGWLN